MLIDWDDAFANGSYIPGSDKLPETWSDRARSFREIMQIKGQARLDITYGENPRQKLDVFCCNGNARGLVVFIHGGYWHKLDKSYWSHLAKGAIESGWNVAIPSYRLAPEVGIAQITDDIGLAISKLAQEYPDPMSLTGHSAGGHLVTRMIGDKSPLSNLVKNRIVKVVPISGIYDLRPLLETEMNQTLKLDDQEALAESPLFDSLSIDIPVIFWVGAKERPEFLRQTRLIDEAWSKDNHNIDNVFDAGLNHFSVIEGLEKADSPIIQAITQIASE